MTTQLKKLLLAFVAASVVSLSGFAIAKEKKEKPVPPPTKQTQVIRAETYKGMEVAQKAYEAKDYAGAIAALDGLKAKEAKFNDYERATLYNLYAAVYYAQDNVPKAIEAYITVLKQPNLNDALRDGSLYALAQLYFISEQYPKAIAVVKKWLAASANPSPEGYALLAQAHYQIQQYKEAEQALAMSREYEKQIPVLKKLAELSGESKHYIYLGQAYNELGQWAEAVTAFRSGLKAKNMDKTADVQMQLGTALFNANRYAEARQSFVAAQQSPTLAQQAGQWVKFVDQEIERRQAVGAE